MCCVRLHVGAELTRTSQRKARRVALWADECHSTSALVHRASQ